MKIKDLWLPSSAAACSLCLLRPCAHVTSFCKLYATQSIFHLLTFITSLSSLHPHPSPCATCKMAKGPANPTAKSGAKGGGKGVPNRHLHARIAYLNQAATYMAMQQPSLPGNGSRIATSNVDSDVSPINSMDQSSDSPQEPSQPGTSLASRGLPNLIASHLRAVSLKSQVRLSQDMKRSICKVCNSPLIPGKTSTEYMENLSKGGKKSWANVQVIHCLNCHSDKRFPVGASRQLKKRQRQLLQEAQSSEPVQLVTR